MDDKELPGFKINDYSGDGDDAADEAGEPAENGSVTHGEGEFSAVMFENEHVGGAEEKAPKTAPEALEEHPGDSEGASEEASGEPKTDSRVEASKRITEAEARAMLVEDNARAKEALKKANSREKKTLAVVIVVAVLLVVAGVAMSIILGGMRKSDGAGSGNGDKQEGNGGNAAVVEKPEEEPEEPEAVELSLDDEVVQKVYGPFASYPGIMGFGFSTFYEWVTGGEMKPDDALMGQILWAASEHVDCQSSEGYIGYCVDGEAARQRFREAFGYDFTDRTLEYGFCGTTSYLAEVDQYFVGTGCGGAAPSYLNHWLYKAEKRGDYIYLYELVEVYTAEFADAPNSTTGGLELIRNKHCHFDQPCSETYVEGEDLLAIPDNVVLVGDNDGGSYDPSLIPVNFREYADELDMVKWTFERNGEGNYVFKGLERVNYR